MFMVVECARRGRPGNYWGRGGALWSEASAQARRADPTLMRGLVSGRRRVQPSLDSASCLSPDWAPWEAQTSTNPRTSLRGAEMSRAPGGPNRTALFKSWTPSEAILLQISMPLTLPASASYKPHFLPGPYQETSAGGLVLSFRPLLPSGASQSLSLSSYFHTFSRVVIFLFTNLHVLSPADFQLRAGHVVKSFSWASPTQQLKTGVLPHFPPRP